MPLRFNRLIVVIIVGLGGLLLLPATPVQAMECVGVRGVGCVYPPKQCITGPCW